MSSADEFQQVCPGLRLWQAYEPQVKSDLFSTALLSSDGLTLIDPIPLTPAPLADLSACATVSRILVTNSNHFRASARFARDFRVPVFYRGQTGEAIDRADLVLIDSATSIARDITPISIDGAVPGETAFHFQHEGGTIVLGDALIHLDPYGFALLPAKYCPDQRTMRKSLRQLLDFSFERLLFAHGRPIVSAARVRLEALLSTLER